MVALRTGILPKWLAWAGLVVALLALLHFLFPLLGAVVGLLWVVVIAILMITGSAAHSMQITHLQR
jgi:hypothetical protein